MADGVHAPQSVHHRSPVAHIRVPPVDAIGDGRRRTVGGGQKCVEHAYLVPGAGESADDVRADEARTSGDQDQHAPTLCLAARL